MRADPNPNPINPRARRRSQRGASRCSPSSTTARASTARAQSAARSAACSRASRRSATRAIGRARTAASRARRAAAACWQDAFEFFVSLSRLRPLCGLAPRETRVTPVTPPPPKIAIPIAKVEYANIINTTVLCIIKTLEISSLVHYRGPPLPSSGSAGAAGGASPPAGVPAAGDPRPAITTAVPHAENSCAAGPAAPKSGETDALPRRCCLGLVELSFG